MVSSLIIVLNLEYINIFSGVELLRFDIIPPSYAASLQKNSEEENEGNRLQDWHVHEDEFEEDEFSVEVLGLSGWREDL